MLGLDASDMPEHLPLHHLGNTILSKKNSMTNAPSTYQGEALSWHPAVAAIMKTAQKGTIIHWKLMWRDLC